MKLAIGSNLLDSSLRYATVAIILILVGGNAQSQPPALGTAKTAQENKNESRPKQPETTANQQSSIDISALTDKVITELARRNQQSPGDKSKEKPAIDWWGIGRDALLVLFTGALAVLAHRQHQAMVQQANYMRDGLGETKKAADAAKEGARIADLSLRITQRPIVLIDSIVMIGPRGMQNPVERCINSRIVVAFKNVGVSIADGFYYAIKVTSNGFPSDLPITVSHKTALQPQMPVIEPLPPLGDMFPHNRSYIVKGVADSTLKVTGFVRYRGALDLAGTYVEFSGTYEAVTDQFLITQAVAEDVGQSPPD